MTGHGNPQQIPVLVAQDGGAPPFVRLGLDSIPTSWYAQSMDRVITPQSRREKLLDAALATIREKGYSSPSVDELCAQAGVSKGAFFHYFKSKDALAVAAAKHWSEITGAFF